MRPGPPPRRLLVLGLCLLVLAAGGLWWWMTPRKAPVRPPMPEDIQEDDVRELIEVARAGVLELPDSGLAWGHLGMVLLAHLFDREADLCFTEAARLSPEEPLWPYGRGLIALKRDPEGALSYLRLAKERADLDTQKGANIALQLAEALLERQQLDEAEVLLNDVKQKSPRNLRAEFNLGLLAQIRGKTDEARKHFLAAQASQFASKRAVVHLAALARIANDTAQATKYEAQVADMPADPPWPDPMLDEVVQLQGGRRGRERKITRLENEGQFAEAAQLHLDQINKKPQASDYIGAGVNLARLREYDRALKLLREGVRLDPDGVQAHYSLGLVLFTRAERELAATPGSTQARDWLRESITHTRKATERKPNHANAFTLWGLALRHLGDSTAAVAPLRRAVECEPSNFEAQLGLGQALLESGNGAEAEKHLENARRLKSDDPRPVAALKRLRTGD